jgi:high-affinity nickel permease
MRHAFDADHISAIDNTTRKLMGEGKHPLSVGFFFFFFFFFGHSSVVFVLALCFAIGIKALGVQVQVRVKWCSSIGTAPSQPAGATGRRLACFGRLAVSPRRPPSMGRV